MSTRNFASIGTGLVAGGMAANQVWSGANGWETAGIAAAAAVIVGVGVWAVIGKVAEHLAKRGR